MITRIGTSTASGVGLVSSHIERTTCAYDSAWTEAGKEITWSTPLLPVLKAYGATLA